MPPNEPRQPEAAGQGCGGSRFAQFGEQPTSDGIQCHGRGCGLIDDVAEANGKIYCEYDAPNAEIVLELSRQAGMPVDRISEISLEINPEMFR